MPRAETYWAGPAGGRPLVGIKDLAWLVYLYPARWLTNLLPIGAAYALWDGLAWLGAMSLRAPRRKLLARLQFAFPSAEEAPLRKKVAAQFFRNSIVRFGGDLLLPRLAREGRLQVDLIHLERLTEAIARGKGALLVSGHFMASRAALHHLAAAGYPSTSIRNLAPLSGSMGRLGERIVRRRYVEFLSEIIGSEISVDDPNRSLKMMALLRAGGLINFHVDAAFSRQVVHREFLGVTYPFGAGGFHLAWLVGAAVVPLTSLGSSRALRIEFGEPIYPADWPDRHAFAAAALERVVQIIEEQVRRAPAEWDLWIRW